VRAPGGITWEAALAAANASTFNGMRGHLATITTPAENEFLTSRLAAAINGGYWLGGFQLPGLLDPAAGWQWVTGEPFSYTAWPDLFPPEPDDRFGAGNTPQDENRLQFRPQSFGGWNDLRPTQTSPRGYVIEYEADPAPGDPLITGYAATEPRGAAIASVSPGTPFLITGANLGTTGTVLFAGIPLPAVVATWSPTEILVYAPTAPLYPFQTPVTVVTDGRRVTGGPLTLTIPVAGRDNLLANGSFEFPDSTRSSSGYYTFGQPIDLGYPSFRGYTIPGWRIPRGTIDLVTRQIAPAPGQGRQSVDMVGSPMAAKIEQTFFTEPGREYLFAGWLGRNPGVHMARADVYVNGAFLVQLHHQGPADGTDAGWQPFSYRFRATRQQTTLTLTDVTFVSDVAGTELDGLIVTPAP
jgi:hypothetical protein